MILQIKSYISGLNANNMKRVFNYLMGQFCKYCGRHCGSVGSGMSINGMCERCYENGGDDE